MARPSWNRSTCITGAELSRWLGLTRQQGTIAAFIAARFTNQEIAQALGIAPSTVKTHAEMVFARLNVTKREQVKQCLLDMLMESVLSRRAEHVGELRRCDLGRGGRSGNCVCTVP